MRIEQHAIWDSLPTKRYGEVLWHPAVPVHANNDSLRANIRQELRGALFSQDTYEIIFQACKFLVIRGRNRLGCS